MDFSPVPATKSAEKKQPAKAPTKKLIKLKLVFDLEMVKNQETVIVNNEGKSRESNTRKSRKKRSTTTHAAAIDPNAAAAAAASIMAQKVTKAVVAFAEVV